MATIEFIAASISCVTYFNTRRAASLVRWHYIFLVTVNEQYRVDVEGEAKGRI